MRAEDSTVTLCDQLRSPSATERAAAAAALGALRDASAVGSLAAALSDGDYWVRHACARALTAIGEAAIDTVGPLLTAGRSVDVREAATAALGVPGGLSALEWLEVAYEDSAYEVRTQAVKSAREVGIAGAPLIERALTDGESEVRIEAISALGRLGDPSCSSALARALEDSSPTVRWTAAIALGETGGTVAVEALIAALGDEWRNVRGQAATTLGQLAHPAAVEALQRVLDDDDDLVRVAATEALESIRSKELDRAQASALREQALPEDEALTDDRNDTVV